MQIRTRLTIQFLLIGGIIMAIASLAVYLSSSGFRKENFHSKLVLQGSNIAGILLGGERIEPEKVRNLEMNRLLNLNNESVVIYNFLDDTIYISDEKSGIKIDYSLIEKVRNGASVYFRSGSYEVAGFQYLARLDRFVVFIAATDDEGLMHLDKLRRILITVCLISLVIFFIAGRVYSGRALKPINDVIKSVNDVTITNLNLRVPEGNREDEIGRLAITFNRMLDRLEKSFSMQKDFIANASHEISTPLTKVNGQIEVLLMKPRSAEDYQKALLSIHEDLISLIYLSKRLLLMAQTSAEDSTGLNRILRIDEIMFQTREEVIQNKKNYNISISLDDSLSDFDNLMVRGEESLLKTAFINVIDNACKYSDDHSVCIQMKRENNSLRIIFEDRGIGIPEDEKSKVFEPFYRASNAGSVPGSGIGLSIVSTIIHNHNGNIKLESVFGKGTSIVIELPLAEKS